MQLILNNLNVIDFEVTVDLDSRQTTSKRLFLMESRETLYTTHILLTQGQQECKEITVYLDVSPYSELFGLRVRHSLILLISWWQRADTMFLFNIQVSINIKPASLAHYLVSSSTCYSIRAAEGLSEMWSETRYIYFSKLHQKNNVVTVIRNWLKR